MIECKVDTETLIDEIIDQKFHPTPPSFIRRTQSVQSFQISLEAFLFLDHVKTGKPG